MSQRQTSIPDRYQGTPFWMALTFLFSLVFVATALAPLALGQTEPAVVDDWLKFRYNQYNTGASPSDAPDTDEVYWIFEGELDTYDVLGFVSSPAAYDHVIYAGCANGRVYAIDEASGALIWEFVTDTWEAWDIPWIIWSSVAVYPEKGLVYVTADKLYAINMEDGSLAWKWESPSQWEFSSPTYEDDVVYFGGMDGYLHAIDANDGTEIWTFETGEIWWGSKQDGGQVISTPAVGPDYVYFVDFDEKLYAVDKGTGDLVWLEKFDDEDPIFGLPTDPGPINIFGSGQGWASPAIDLENERLYVADTSGKLYAMTLDGDADSTDNDLNGQDDEGDRIWEIDLTADGISASPAYDGENVFVSGWDQTMYAVNKMSGTITWTAPLGGYPWGSVSNADGMVFQNSFNFAGGRQGWFQALDGESGNEIWSFYQDEFMVSTPTPYNGKILLGDCGYRLSAWAPDGPKPDLYVEDITATDDDDGERYVYATVGNKAGTVRGPPFQVEIFVDGNREYNESYGSLDPGELTGAMVKVDMGGGSHEIEVKITQHPSGWYHIAETNLANNEDSIKVGGVIKAIAGGSVFAIPLWFILGLLLGFGLAWLFAGGREKEERRYLPHVAEITESPLGAGKKVKIDWENIQYITSEKAKRYHMADCPFAVNIPEPSRILLSQDEADKSAKKPCKCTEIKSAHDISYRHAKDAETGQEIVEAEQGEVLDAEQT